MLGDGDGVMLPVTEDVGDRVAEDVGDRVSDGEGDGDGLGDGDALGLAMRYIAKSSDPTYNARSRPTATLDCVLMGADHSTVPVAPSNPTRGPYKLPM
jgi:hypothetical protein